MKFSTLNAFNLVCFQMKFFLGIMRHGIYVMVLTGGLQAVDQSFGDISGLDSESYETREATQKKLLQWSFEEPDLAARTLLEVLRGTASPEVRERCQMVLRSMSDADYQNQGEGYIGIRMQDELTTVPGVEKPQWAIRIGQVVLGSAAERAGLRLNDLIVGMEGFEWPGGEASVPFGQRIKQLKPRVPIGLKVLRDGGVVRIEVVLGKRPAALEQPFIGGGVMELAEAEQKAKDAYFRVWLRNQQLRLKGR